MTQVESGRIQIQLQTVNPVLIIDKAIETVASSAKEKNIELVRIEDNNLPSILADGGEEYLGTQ
jgi:signal transduction histidine kinase